MTAAYCPSCGSLLAPGDRFCENCGAAAVPAPGYVPYGVPPMPPRRDNTALIVVAVILVVVLMVALPALLYVMVAGLIGPPTSFSPPGALGVRLSRSSDGSNWILTFTSVPAGFLQNGTFFSLASVNGSSLLWATTLFQLEGNGVAGARYIPYITGPAVVTCAAGDQILVAYGTGTDQYPPGTRATISTNSDILYVGTLQ